VWGVGRQLAPRLRDHNILTAADLALADPRVLHRQFSSVLVNTARELRGESCIAWTETPAPKQQIICSRSFGEPVQDFEALAQALSLFTSRAAEKLRAQQALADTLFVFASTSPFRKTTPRYSGHAMIPLPTATSRTPELVSAALH